MKRNNLIQKSSILLISVLTFCVFAGNVRVKGSSTVLPVAQKTAEVYMKQNPKATIIVEGGGSGVGIAALLDGTTDIANASREMKAKETKIFKSKKKVPVVHVVGRDALSVIVHPSNPVKSLSIEQVASIFKGKIKNWKEVGGKDMPVVAIARESSSGTYGFFKSKVLKKKAYASTCLSSSSNGAMVQSVSQTEGAIGYAGLAYVNDNVRALSIKNGGKPVEATFENAVKGAYPLVRNLNMITSGKPSGSIKNYLDFVLSTEGQKLVKQVGYIPVK